MNEEKQKRILVVDDEADVREYLKVALEDEGFLVDTAADGLEALEQVKRQPPDLISLDLIMPRHSGARFYHDLQKEHHLAKIPVLIITGHARDELGHADFKDMTMHGPGVYLEKPVSPASYVAAVRSMLGMEAPEQPDPDKLRREVAHALSEADQATLLRALDALKKK